MSIKVLRQKRADLIAEAQKLFDAAAAENRGLNETEAKRDDDIQAELTALEPQIQRAERQMERQRSMGIVVDGNAAASERPNNGKKFRSLGDFAMSVILASRPNDLGGPIVDPRLSAGPTGLSEGNGADGGFLVDTQFLPELLTPIYNTGEIARRVRRFGIGAGFNGMKMNGVDETSRANGSRWGGIRTYWTGEAQLMNSSAPKFRKIAMELEKLTGLCYATDELMRDVTFLGAWLEMAFREEFSFKVEDGIMNGTGAGMPLGYLNSGAVITVDKEAGQGATIVAENVSNMWARMPARNRRSAIWLCNQEVEPQFDKFHTKVKNVAEAENVGGVPSNPIVYREPGEVAGSEYGSLKGKPVIPVEYAAGLGTAGDLQLVDLSQYMMIDKDTIDSQQSIHVRFLYDELTFRFIYRANGQPLWQAPLTPYKGTKTQSPFVVLQSR